MLGEDRLLVGDANRVGGERRAVDLAVDLDLTPRGVGQPADIDLAGEVDKWQLAASRDLSENAPLQRAKHVGGCSAGDRGLQLGGVVGARDAGELDLDTGIGLLECRQDLEHGITPLGVVAPHGDRHRVLGVGADGEACPAECRQRRRAANPLQEAAPIEARSAEACRTSHEISFARCQFPVLIWVRSAGQRDCPRTARPLVARGRWSVKRGAAAQEALKSVISPGSSTCTIVSLPRRARVSRKVAGSSVAPGPYCSSGHIP